MEGFTRKMGLRIAHLNAPKCAIPKGSSGYIPPWPLHSFKKYLLSTYYVSSIVLGTWDSAMKKTDRFACPHEAGILVVRERIRKKIKISKLQGILETDEGFGN